MFGKIIKKVLGGGSEDSSKETSNKNQKSKTGGLTPKVLFENENLLFINKPAGLMVHSDGKTTEATLCDWVIKKYPNMKGIGEPSRTPTGEMVDRPGIVHRLDKDTSGVLVLAKTQASFENLKKQFQEREIKKIYNAFVWGVVKEDKGVVDRPIGRSKNDFRKWSAERFARGELRPAVTEYKVLNRILKEEKSEYKDTKQLGKTGSNIPKQFTYLELFPKTGRTHQIRVHMKAINHPVVGDSLYAPNHPKELGFERLALHARFLEITDLDGSKVSAEAPLPEDFANALKVLGL